MVSVLVGSGDTCVGVDIDGDCAAGGSDGCGCAAVAEVEIALTGVTSWLGSGTVPVTLVGVTEGGAERDATAIQPPEPIIAAISVATNNSPRNRRTRGSPGPPSMRAARPLTAYRTTGATCRCT